jgi:hypothetical protein
MLLSGSTGDVLPAENGNQIANGNTANENHNGNGSAQGVWLEESGIAVEVDQRSALRVYLVDAEGQQTPLTAALYKANPTASVFIGDQRIDDFNDSRRRQLGHLRD